MSKRVMLTVAYDGTQYHGWQIQPNVPTIEGVLNQHLSEMLGEQIEVIGASRTDAGVHASGQVVHVSLTDRTGGPWSPIVLLNGLNALLPQEVRVLQVKEIGESFHAQRSAYKKQYSYYFLSAL